jgi:hypothetical protein
MRIGGFFWTQAAGAFNDNLYKMALIVWITFAAPDLSDAMRSTLVILCSGIFILPFFLFSASAGWLADRYPKDQVIRWTKLAEIAIMLVGALAFIFTSLPTLIIVLFLMGVQSAVFGPAKYGIIPELCTIEGASRGGTKPQTAEQGVPTALLRANGLVAMGSFVAILLGTLAGTLLGAGDGLAALLGFASGLANATLGTDLGLFSAAQAIEAAGSGLILPAACVMLIAVFGYIASRAIPKLPARAPMLKRQGNIFQETAHRLRDISAMPKIFPYLLAIAWFWFHGAYILQLLPLWAAGGEQGTAFVTIALLLFSCGIGLGSLLCGLTSRRRRAGTENAGNPVSMSAPALAVLAVATLSIAFLPQGSLPGFAALALSGLAAGYYSIPLYAYIQRQSGEDMRARIFSGGNILDAAFMVIASLVMQAFESAAFTHAERFILLAVMDVAFLVWFLRQGRQGRI